MANENSALHRARTNKEDEFYTQLSDIEEELKHYRRHFKDKVVLCNCDDPFESNFFKYFVLNFNRLKLKKLIATCYATSPIVGQQLSLFDVVENAKAGTPYKAEVTVVRDATGDGAINMDDIAELFKLGENKLEVLEGDGDFRSEECLALMDEADIVVTNPPFSLFREYISLLDEHDKKFVIIGNQNAITYKEFFDMLKDNKVWVGYKFGDMAFRVPESYEPRATRYWQDEDGQKWRSLGNVCWYTNLDIKKLHDELVCVRRYYGHEDEYPTYDNYDAINVGKNVDIPIDYKGVMGVPITFIDKYCPEQFEILGKTDRQAIYGYRNKVYTVEDSPKYNDLNRGPAMYVDGELKAIYQRILIRYTDQWIEEHPEDFKESK